MSHSSTLTVTSRRARSTIAQATIPAPHHQVPRLQTAILRKMRRQSVNEAKRRPRNPRSSTLIPRQTVSRKPQPKPLLLQPLLRAKLKNSNSVNNLQQQLLPLPHCNQNSLPMQLRKKRYQARNVRRTPLNSNAWIRYGIRNFATTGIRKARKSRKTSSTAFSRCGGSSAGTTNLRELKSTSKASSCVMRYALSSRTAKVSAWLKINPV